MNVQRVVRFGTFEFNFASGELRSKGRKVALQSQPGQVLSHLLSRPGEVVTREELQRAIWSDETFVDFDAALNVAINKVRHALNDSPTTPRFVETIPRRGYRFLADVHVVDPGDALAPPARVSRVVPATFPVRWGWARTLVLVAALPAVWSAVPFDSETAAPKSVAVLPFRPLIAETRDEALELGLTEAVIIRLGQLKQLRVPSINAVQRYARINQDPRAAGRDLGVEAVLDGSLVRGERTVRLSARLLDVRTGTTLWADQWDFSWTDIFTVQDVMATEVSRALAVPLGSEEQRSLRDHPTNIAAYDAYLRARHLLRRRTIADSRRAVELLEEAVRRDPTSGAAYASLGFAYISVSLLDGPTVPFMTQGRQAAQRALDLDPTLAEPHSVLGRILVRFDWDAEAGDRESRRGLELEPDNAFVLHCYSLILADEGRFADALRLADRAVALDPTSVVANRDRAFILYLARRYDESVQQARRALELDPYDAVAYSVLGQSYERLDRPDEAVDAYLTPLTFSEQNRERLAVLRSAAREGGLKEFWRRRLQFLLQEPEVRMRSVASAFVRIGDHERALEWLEKLYAARGAQIRSLKTNPEWDPIRAEPRFRSMLSRVNSVHAPEQLLSRRHGGPSRAVVRPGGSRRWLRRADWQASSRPLRSHFYRTRGARGRSGRTIPPSVNFSPLFRR